MTLCSSAMWIMLKAPNSFESTFEKFIHHFSNQTYS